MRSYRYTARPLGIYVQGAPQVSLPVLRDPALVFEGTPEEALGFFFSKGYDLYESKNDLWIDNGETPVYEMFMTTVGNNSTEDNVPNRMSVLFSQNPYTSPPGSQYILQKMFFTELMIQRTLPTTGGRKKMKTRRRNKRRNCTRTRSSFPTKFRSS